MVPRVLKVILTPINLVISAAPPLWLHVGMERWGQGKDSALRASCAMMVPKSVGWLNIILC